MSTAGAAPAPPSAAFAASIARVRCFGRRHHLALLIVATLVTLAALGWVIAGRRHAFADALGHAETSVLATAAALQIIALLARSEAWHLSIQAAGGRVARRALYRASSMQVLGGLLNSQLGVAARIAALRRSSPDVCPQVPTLVAAELPILTVEAFLAAAFSFTLVGPLALPWWLPVIAIAVIASASAGLRHLAIRKGRKLWRGLAIARSVSHAGRLVLLVFVAILAQIVRNWMLLHAVGLDVSLLDAVAVLIAVVTLAQLPIGPGASAAAAVLILGHHGVAATAAAGVLLTVTGTIGGLLFAAWATTDHLFTRHRRRAVAGG